MLHARRPVINLRVTQVKPDRPITPRHAWQPFTPRGVAAFAHATGTRLLIVQSFVALAVVMTFLWFLSSRYFPVVGDAIAAVEDEGMITASHWITTNATPRLLAGNRHFEILLDAREQRGPSSTADLSVTVTVPALRICGILGCASVRYEPGYTFMLNRHALAAAWDAWRRPSAALFGIAVFLALFASWWLVALIATPLVKTLVFFTDRRLTWGGSWRLSNAALLAGALVVAAGVFLYGVEAIDLFQLMLFYALHAVCDVILLATSPFFLPKLAAVDRAKNPFATTSPRADKAAPKTHNPFGAP